MANQRNFFVTRTGIIAAGAVIGVLAPLLQKLGNPVAPPCYPGGVNYCTHSPGA